MIVAIWRSPADALPESLARGLAALLATSGFSRVDEGCATLAVRYPAHLARRGSGVTAWATSGGGGYVPPGLPSVRLEQGNLTIAAPAVPQFPLYYARASDNTYLLVSSRLGTLAQLLPSAPINAQRVVSNIADTLDGDRGSTVYAGIRRLLPSETIAARSGTFRVERSLPRIGRRYRTERVEDLADELRDQLDAAVARTIGPSTRVAVLVSGGLDSSGILALPAARCRGATRRELHAISLQTKGPGDDRPYFNQLVEALGIVPVRLSASDAGAWFRSSLCADAQPAGGGAAACLDMLFYGTAAKLGAEIGLCGSAGDYLCGGPLPFGQLVCRGRAVAAVKGALRIRLPWSMTPWARIRSFVLRPFVPPALLRARRRGADRQSWMTSRFRSLLRRCRDATDRGLRPLPDSPDEWMAEWCEGNDVVLPTMADCGGQSASVTDVAVFDVFMDFDFVRFILQIDPVLLSHGDEYRGLYRLAMKGILPEPIRTRQDKASYESAIAAAAVAANALDLLRDLSSLKELAARDLVDPSPLRPLFELWFASIQRGERDEADAADEYGRQLWQLLSVEAFLREHGRGRDLV